MEEELQNGVLIVDDDAASRNRLCRAFADRGWKTTSAADGAAAIEIAAKSNIVASITGDAFLKLLVGKMLHQLRKDGLSEIHASLSPLSKGRSQRHFSWFPFQIVPDSVRRQPTDATIFICPQRNFPRTAV